MYTPCMLCSVCAHNDRGLYHPSAIAVRQRAMRVLYVRDLSIQIKLQKRNTAATVAIADITHSTHYPRSTPMHAAAQTIQLN